MRDGVPTIALGDAHVRPVILSAFHLLLSKTLKGLCWGWRAGAEEVAEGYCPGAQRHGFTPCLGTVLNCWQK